MFCDDNDFTVRLTIQRYLPPGHFHVDTRASPYDFDATIRCFATRRHIICIATRHSNARFSVEAIIAATPAFASSLLPPSRLDQEAAYHFMKAFAQFSTLYLLMPHFHMPPVSTTMRRFGIRSLISHHTCAFHPIYASSIRARLCYHAYSDADADT